MTKAEKPHGAQPGADPRADRGQPAILDDRATLLRAQSELLSLLCRGIARAWRAAHAEDSKVRQQAESGPSSHARPVPNNRTQDSPTAPA